MNNWHLIYTKSRQEEVAFNNLVRQGYETYLPFVTVEKILRGKKSVIKEPMFPKYLFVRFSIKGNQNWAPIRSTKGVSHLVTFGNTQATLDNDVVDALKQKLDLHSSIKAFQLNDKVEIIDGPFKGLEAIFKIYDGEERAVLFLNFMSKNIAAKFGVGYFKKIA